MRKNLLAIGAIALSVATATAAGSLLWRRYGPSTYLRFNTMFGRTRIYQVEDDDGTPVRLLEVGGIVQSGCYLDERYADLVFEYLKRYDLMFEDKRDVRSVCVLGCGGYDYPKHLLAHHAPVLLDAVEIDPAITSLARRYFFLDRAIEEYDAGGARLNLVCADALEFLASADKRYDAIVNDTFDAGTPPRHLTTPEFAQLVRSRLAPGGQYLTNIVAPLEGAEAAFLREQVAILQSIFDEVRVIPCATDEFAEADNVIVIAKLRSES